MSKVATHLAKARSFHSLMHRFRNNYSPDSDDLFIFYEGEDDRDYYYPYFSRRNISGRTIRQFVCDGKAIVLKLCEEIHSKYDHLPRLAFMLDKDFDDFMSVQYPIGQNIFVTDLYSIENYLVSESALTYILVTIFRLEEEDPIFQNIVVEFGQRYAEYVDAILPLMAWVISAKMDGHKPNLNNVTHRHLRGWFSGFDGGALRRQTGALSAIKRQIGLCDYSVPPTRLKLLIDDIRVRGERSAIRGKYDLWFLLEFLRFALRTYGNTPKLDGKPLKASVDVSANNFFAVVSHRDYPEALDAFSETIAA